MEGFLDSQHGVAVLLSSLVIILCLNFIVRVGEFLFKLLKKKDESNDKNMAEFIKTLSNNTHALNHLSSRTDSLEKVLKEVVKYKRDIRKLFTAIKAIAGDEWSEIRKSIIEDDFSS